VEIRSWRGVCVLFHRLDPGRYFHVRALKDPHHPKSLLT